MAAWPTVWATLSKQLELQVPHQALNSLLSAFEGLWGLKSVKEFLGYVNQVNGFTGEHAEDNLGVLYAVLASVWRDLGAVRALRAALETYYPGALDPNKHRAVNLSAPPPPQNVIVVNNTVASAAVATPAASAEAAPLPKLGPGPAVLENKFTLTRVAIADLGDIMIQGAKCEVLVLNTSEEAEAELCRRAAVEKAENAKLGTKPSHTYLLQEVKVVAMAEKPRTGTLDEYTL